MQYNQRQKWKKRIFALIALVIAVIMVMGLVSPVFAASAEVTAVSAAEGETQTEEKNEMIQEEIGDTEFSSDFSIGFDGKYIVGKTAPVLGTITNHGADFQGEIQIKASLFVDNDREYQSYALYTKKLNLPKGATQEISMELGLSSIRKNMEIELVDSKGTVVYRKNVPVEALAPETVAVAVLSSQPEDVKYLSGMEQYLPAERNQVFFFDRDSFPRSAMIMDNFDVVLIDDFDTATLSNDQKKALESWTLGGGILALGTGPYGNRVLTGLTFLGDVAADGSTEISSMTDIYGNTIALSQPMQLASIRGENVKPLWKNGDVVFTSTLECGGGTVLIHHFALGLTPFANLSNGAEILAQAYSSWEEDALLGDMDLDYLDHYADRFSGLESNGLILIFGCIVVYMILVGPVLFVVLRKKEKQIWGWVVIPALSLGFLGIVFLCSMNSAYKNSMVNVVSLIEVEEGASYGNANIGITIKSPKKGDVVFSMEEDLSIIPKMEDYYYSGGKRNVSECEYRVETGEEKSITFYDSSTWQSNQLTAKSIVDLGGVIHADVRQEGDTYFCTVTNDSSVDFVDAYVTLFNEFLSLGEMPAGTKKEVSFHLEDQTNYDLRQRMEEVVWNGEGNLREQVEAGRISKQEAFRKNLEVDLLNSVSYSGDTSYFDSKQTLCSFYGFSDAMLLEGSKYVNQKAVKESNLHLYHTTFSVDYADMEYFSLPYVIGPQAEEEDWRNFELYYDSWAENYYLNSYTDEEQEVTLFYQVDADLWIQTFQFYADWQNIPGHPIEIYHRSTDTWEELQADEYENASEYVDEENRIKIRVYLQQDGMIAPKMRMEGGGRNA